MPFFFDNIEKWDSVGCHDEPNKYDKEFVHFVPILWKKCIQNCLFSDWNSLNTTQFNKKKEIESIIKLKMAIFSHDSFEKGITTV